MSDGYVTVGQCVDGLPIGAFAWELLFCGFLAWFLLGAISEFTPMSASFTTVMGNSHDDQLIMSVSAMLVLGHSVAILLGGWLADTYGRVAVIRPALILTIFCGTLMQAASTYHQLLASRFALGLCSGSLLGVMPPLLAELLPSRHRGFYLTVWCCGWPAGSLFSLVLGNNWRLFYTWTLVPAVILYLCSRAEMLPESPRYLYLAGRKDEGYEVLADMYEKEDLPLPWSAETISVSCAIPRGSEMSSQPRGAPPEVMGWHSFGVSSPSGSANAAESATSSVVASSARAIQAVRSSCGCAVFTSSGAGVAVWLAIVMFCVSAASQALKFWLPTILVESRQDSAVLAPDIKGVAALHGHVHDHSSVLIGGGPPIDVGALGFGSVGSLGSMLAPVLVSFGRGRRVLERAQEPMKLLPGYDPQVSWILAQAYVLQIFGIFACAYASTWMGRRRMVQCSFFGAALFLAAVLSAALHGALILCGPLFGLQLSAQAAIVNFLLVFATEHFPTSRRARSVALVSFAAQLGTFTVPTLSGMLAKPLSVTGAVICFSSLYLFGGIFSLRLPLPSIREHPLQDIDNDARMKKREWATYQAI